MTPAGRLEVGRVVERYRVEERLGEGGTAAVYRVRHVHLGTDHALKVLTLLGASAAPRLLLEGRIQAALRHPNILAVTDVLEVDHSYGLLMEYVPPPNLSGLLVTGRLPHATAEALFRGIVAGVAHAHRHGLVHRDLKPQNVLLATAEEGRVPKVADFGLARLLEDDEGSRQTRSGLAMGTPPYMAPEQFRDAKGVDRRADLFSLGCILHELVSGRPAFAWTDMIQVYRSMMDQGWARLPEDVPRHLRAAIEGCLEPDRDTRIPDCSSLLAVLDGADRRGTTLVPGAERLPEAAPTPDTWSGEDATRVDGEAITWPASGGIEVADSVRTVIATPMRLPYAAPPPIPSPAPLPSGTGTLVSVPASAPPSRVPRIAGIGLVGIALAVTVALWPSAPEVAPEVAPPVVVLPTPEPIAPEPAPPLVEPPEAAPPVQVARPRTVGAASTRPPDPVVTPPPEPVAVAVPVVGPVAVEAAPVALPVEAAPVAAPTHASVRFSGARTAWLAAGSRKHVLPERVPPGHYAVWADFGAGPVAAGEIDLAAGDDVSLRCSEGFQSCR